MTDNRWTRFNGYLFKYWKLEALVISLGLLTVPLGLINPYLTKLVIDRAYGNKDVRLFFILAAVGGGVFVLNGIANSVSSYLSQRVKRRVHFDMTRDLFNHLQGLSLGFFDNRSTGEHIYRINQDVMSVSEFVCNSVPQAIMLFPRLLLILAIVFWLNWKMALLTAMLFPAAYLHPYLFGKWLKDSTRRSIARSQGIYSILQEVFSHMRLVKAFGREEGEARKFSEHLFQRMNIELKNAKVSNLAGLSGSVLNKALSGAIALYGGYQVIKGAMTLGSLTAVMIYLTQLISLLGSVGSFLQTVAVSSVTRQRVAEILDVKPDIKDAPDAAPRPFKKGRIEFRDVSFSYKRGSSVLKSVSFSIEGGSKVALVGPSGCGKTTILSLLLRLYEQAEGAIIIDGIDARKVKLDSLKSQIGAALQEPFLWNDTIANNILYGAVREASGSGAVIRAAKEAEADIFITGLPNGYESRIGEMACRLSEGQKQRIALARALIRDPKILIMDEALASLDSETEDRIIENIKLRHAGATVIAASHRLSTVRKMDRVIFIQDGSCVEAGRHEDLMERSPKYRELFAGQIEEPAGSDIRS